MKFNSLFFIFLLMFALMMMLIGSTFYEAKIDEGIEDFDIYNLTEHYLNWNYTTIDEYYNISYNNSNIEDIKINRINRVLVSGINFFGVTVFEFGKYFIEFGYENPEYDFEFMIKVVKWILILMVLFALAPAIIYIFLLLYLFYEFIANIIKRRRKKANAE